MNRATTVNPTVVGTFHRAVVCTIVTAYCFESRFIGTAYAYYFEFFSPAIALPSYKLKYVTPIYIITYLLSKGVTPTRFIRAI